MCKRWLSVFICLLILSSTAVPARAVQKTEPQAMQFTISSLDAFLDFAEHCRLDSFSQNLRAVLRTDIDLTGTGFAGIPIFCGSFEGNGHIIKGLSLKEDGSHQGLFRYLSDTAVVRDLNVVGTVQPGGTACEVGGIAGSNDGAILNCSFTGYVSGKEYIGGIAGKVSVSGLIENCSVNGRVYGAHFVGGTAGSSSGVIRSCVNEARINDTALENTVELTDITLNSLTSSEAANTVTDIGGIVGHSMGVIRDCENRGSVGYQHMGYNIGGIAGTQSGALLNCTNYAQIHGRKEVGGIVGQLEPTALIEYEEDALQILKRQLSSMGSAVNETVSSIQGTTDAIVSQVGQLRNHVGNAQDAVDSLIPDREDPHLPDLDTIQAAKNTISSSISGMTQTLEGMNATVYGAMGAMSTNLYTLQSQINAMRSTLGNVSETLGGSITDVSDKDTELDLTGKVAGCRNYGTVLADRNAGGIAGAIAMENDLDYQEDWSIRGENSLNFESELRAVILQSTNSAEITCGKQNAGGIVGWQSMGLVRDCMNSGALNAGGADYVGGISGQSLGFIRTSAAKCLIKGSSNVGGIAGSATIVTDCRSLVRLDGIAEKAGEVLGTAEQPHVETENPISGNFYFSPEEDMGAIDGISYDAQAQSLSKTDFLSLEGLPEMFRGAVISFCYPNGLERTFTIPLGEGFNAQWIPPIPPREGYAAEWEGLAPENLEQILFDMTFTPSYSSKVTTLQSDRLVSSRPVLLVQGVFADGAKLNVTESDAAVPMEMGETLVGSWEYTVSGAEALTLGRIHLNADTDADRVRVLIREGNGQWHQIDHRGDGSYLVVDLTQSDGAIALVQEPSRLMLYVLIAGTAGMVFVIGCLLKRREKRYPQ